MRTIDVIRSFLAGTFAVACLLPAGCGRGGPATKVVHGSISYGGEKIERGQVTFVSLEGNAGPNRVSPVVDGEYRIADGGGVPVGKYRVCIDARKTTGRKVRGSTGLEPAMIDEEVRVGPVVYASDQSPLVADVRADSDGTFDFTIPQQ